MNEPDAVGRPRAADAGPQDPVRLLWTGGWDSSFRLMQLLLVEHRPVQPIYVLMAERATAHLELQAIEVMRDGVRDRLQDPRLLRPLQVLLASDYPPAAWQRDTFEAIRAQVRLGTQYLALAGVAEHHGWRGVELSVERYSTPDGFNGWSRLVFERPGVLKSSPEAEFFTYWSFPVLHLLKEEMRVIAREHDFLDLLERRWFCHDPVGETPCGRCQPCRLAISDGVRFANPVLSLSRAALRKVPGAARYRSDTTAAGSVAAAGGRPPG